MKEKKEVHIVVINQQKTHIYLRSTEYYIALTKLSTVGVNEGRRNCFDKSQTGFFF